MSAEAGLVRHAVVIRSAAHDAGVEVADEAKGTLVVRLAVRGLDDLLAVAGGEGVAALGRAAA